MYYFYGKIIDIRISVLVNIDSKISFNKGGIHMTSQTEQQLENELIARLCGLYIIKINGIL